MRLIYNELGILADVTTIGRCEVPSDGRGLPLKAVLSSGSACWGAVAAGTVLRFEHFESILCPISGLRPGIPKPRAKWIRFTPSRGC